MTDAIAARVFLTLRLPRTCMALIAGFALGIAGCVYQVVFQNPLASPDIIGVASGSCAGAAFAILSFGGGIFATAGFAFTGGLIAVAVALTLTALSRRRGMLTLILSGIVVNALSQSLLMLMKLTADPERELASIEFWTMGSFADITMRKFVSVLPVVFFGLIGLFLLCRQILLLGLNEEDALMLGVSVTSMRRIILSLATLITAAVISVTGMISFIGLLAPHIARLLARTNHSITVTLSGFVGGCLLLLADILARSIASTEIPISILTSLLGGPFLFWLMCRGKEENHG